MKVQVSTESNKYFTAYFDVDLCLFEICWQEESSDMTDDDYKESMGKVIQLMLDNDYLPLLQYQLLDNRSNLFTMSPELQEWQSEHIGKQVVEAIGDYPKTAFIQSEDFITQLSFEQTMEETGETSGLVRYFDNELDAKAWLLDVADSTV
ncbi:STAS/SEC14 domain-containing protein [uncultured Microscilla sp.]|uniref:STAS/SEC14 domain-containing protein n=1 Tax=uncultured Microscilla sp. TaxID=432653 RepID=UPI0026261FE0|nr:STAS/SEC14 domain-containing protein [uncultured Microscilla sp.]